jgi:hypothetical protein
MVLREIMMSGVSGIKGLVVIMESALEGLLRLVYNASAVSGEESGSWRYGSSDGEVDVECE